MGFIDFVKRNKFKFMLAGGAAGAIVVIKKVLSNYEKQWQTSSSRSFVHEARKKEIHFENIINECNQLCHQLSPSMNAKLQKHFDDSYLIEQISSKSKDMTVDRKVELWKTLKVKVMTRLVSEIYSTCIIVCTTRVQMSVIGGFIFAAKNTDSSGGPSSASVAELTHLRVYQRYIELLTAIQAKRFDCLVQPVEETVEQVMKDYKIDQEISIQDFKTILERIKQSMAFLFLTETANKSIIFDKNVLTSPDVLRSENAITLSNDEEKTLLNMLNETQDILEGNDFRQVLQSSIDVGYAVLMDSLLEAFMALESQSQQPGSSKDNETEFSNPNIIKVHLAKILPQIRKTMSNRSEAEQKALVNHLLCLDVLNCFAANVYEAFCTSAQ